MDAAFVRQALVEYLEGQAQWRAEVGERYPGDMRNEAAMAYWDQLADTARQLDDADPLLAGFSRVVYPDVISGGEEAMANGSLPSTMRAVKALADGYSTPRDELGTLLECLVADFFAATAAAD